MDLLSSSLDCHTLGSQKDLFNFQGKCGSLEAMVSIFRAKLYMF